MENVKNKPQKKRGNNVDRAFLTKAMCMVLCMAVCMALCMAVCMAQPYTFRGVPNFKMVPCGPQLSSLNASLGNTPGVRIILGISEPYQASCMLGIWPGIWRVHAGHLPSICRAYAGHMPGIGQAYAGPMPVTCLAYARHMYVICPACAWHMPGISPA